MKGDTGNETMDATGGLVRTNGGTRRDARSTLHQSSTLDQDSEGSSPGGAGDYRQGQTFTAGRSGFLDRIELNGVTLFEGTGQVNVQITSVNQDGEPTSTALGSGSFDSSELPSSYPTDWVSVSINPTVQVTSGVQYAIVLTQSSGANFYWKQTTDPYLRGQPFDYDKQGVIDGSDDGFDYFFRTYVLTPPTTPTCFGQTATIYVKDGKIVGGPDNGKTYAGKLNGTKGNDVIVGTDGKDTIEGNNGNDLICGLGGDDTLRGNNDDDKIDGGSGNDKVDGGNGDDQFIGGDGDDTLTGNDGNDTLNGGNGKDRLEGGNGNDTLTGGSGADKFSGGPGTDTATDYNAGEGDTRDSIP